MRLARNSVFSVVQVLVSTAAMLVAYRQISTRLGLAELGIWSVVSAVAAVGRIADLGAGSAMVRLLPPVLAKGERKAAGGLIVTAFTLVILTLLVVLPAVFPLLVKFTSVFVADTHANLIRRLLMLSLAALACNAGAGCLLGALEAMQRYDQRFATVLIANVAFIGTVLATAPALGLVGLALGAIAQAVVSVLVGWWFVRTDLQLRTWVPVGLHKGYARRVLSIGGPLQAITLANLAFEPTTRLLLARFAGLEWAAIFDVAERIVSYGRSLLMAALQVTTPRFAALARDERKQREGIYRLVYGLSWSLGVVGFGMVYVVLPALGAIALGTPRPELVVLGGVLAIAWHMNTMSAAAYFSIIGGGRLRWIVVAHIALAVVNLVLGLWLGTSFGAMGVIAAFVVALAVGSALNLAGHHKDFGYAILPISARDTALTVAVAGILVFATLAQTQWTSVTMTYLLSAIFSVALLALGAYAMRHTLLRLWQSGVRNGE